MNKYFYAMAAIVLTATSANAQNYDPNQDINESARRAHEWGMNTHKQFMEQQRQFDQNLWDSTREYNCRATRGRMCP